MDEERMNRLRAALANLTPYLESDELTAIMTPMTGKEQFFAVMPSGEPKLMPSPESLANAAIERARIAESAIHRAKSRR